MADNSQQLLDDVLRQQRDSLSPTMSDQDYFEVFCAEQILKDFDLTYDELQAGIVDGAYDGGIDSAYAFVNGEIICEDFDVTPFKKDARIELHIIQSKTSGGYGEDPINRLISTTRNLLKLDANYDSLTQYNTALKTVIDNFRQTYRKLASKFPTFSLHYYYASKKADTAIPSNVQLKADELKTVARELFSDADITVEFLGARRLLELARRRPKTTYGLKVSKNISDVDGYVVLCALNEYAKFLKDQNGKIRSELFESNVRDFQGTTEVNAEIVNTLQHEKIVDFWWMNNGVTILASRATLNGDTVTIENPQIVNGLQTSTQIAHRYVSNPDDARCVMVKIISSENDETRDKIIKATNSQNPIQPSTLRATDKVQRDIEEALKSTGMYYDRRKNYYKNEGKPADKIVSIPLMAQAIMTLILGKPDSARARPSSLIKDNSVYSQVFSEDHPIALYTNAAVLIRQVDRVLKSRPDLYAQDRSNLRFYALFWLASMLTKTVHMKALHISKLDAKNVSDDAVENAVNGVQKIYVALGKTDQVAKGPDLSKGIVEEISRRLSAATILNATI